MTSDYTELELLSHAYAVLEVALEQGNLKDAQLYINAAQHKLNILKGRLEELECE